MAVQQEPATRAGALATLLRHRQGPVARSNKRVGCASRASTVRCISPLMGRLSCMPLMRSSLCCSHMAANVHSVLRQQSTPLQYHGQAALPGKR